MIYILLNKFILFYLSYNSSILSLLGKNIFAVFYNKVNCTPIDHSVNHIVMKLIVLSLIHNLFLITKKITNLKLIILLSLKLIKITGLI